jgi:SAM-dependent methyltransferase
MRARLVLISLVVLTASFDSPPAGFAAERLAQDRPEPFVPRSGQPGKDVVWVPSPPEMVDKMLELAKVTPSDYVIDLGSGDGRNVIAAAKLGANALGVEYNPDMVALSERLAKEAGVADKATFVQGDMYVADISKATVMALFLLPVNLNKLAPKFLDLTPGTRIVANTFGIDGWEPDVRVSMPPESECESWCEVLLWIVPAKVAGGWNMPDGRLELTQDYQMLHGSAIVGGESHMVTMGRLYGDEISFIAGANTYRGKVSGNRIVGTVTTAGGTTPWTATRP